MPFGVTAAVAGGLVEAGIGAATADILAAGIVGAGSGALIGGISSSLSGGSFWGGAGKGALLGGVTGGIGGAVGGVAGGAVDQAAFMAGDDAADAAAGIGGAGASTIGGATDAAGAAIGGAGSAATNGGAAAAPAVASGAAPAAAPASSSGFFGKLGDAVSNNPLKTLQVALAAKQAFSAPQVNVGQNASNVIGTNPGFNAALPQYSMSGNTATPYAGNWYTYGQTGHAPLYNSTLIPPVTQARGGLIKGYSHGGSVRGYAMGGMPMPMANGAPPMMAPQGPPAMGGMPPQASAPRNPLATQNGFAIGKALGQQMKAAGTLNKIKTPKDAHRIGTAIGAHLASPTYAGDGQVPGHGTGQSDSVPARLSVDEFIIPADVVADLGDGSSRAGAKALTHLIKGVRAHKAVKGFPPKARNPLSYLPKAGA